MDAYKRKIYYLMFVLLMASFIPSVVLANGNYNNYRHFTVANGLLNNNVKTVFTDRNGFVWIGSNSGLQRFDGYAFLSYRNVFDDSLSLPNNVVQDIDQDMKGRMWIVTQKGACIFNSINGSFVPVPAFNTTKEPVNVKTAVTGFDKGVWFTAHSRGLYYYDEFRKEIKNYKKTPNLHKLVSELTVTFIVPDSTGNLWLATKEKGLLYCNFKEDKLVVINASWANDITKIEATSNGNLIIASGGKLFRFNTANLSSQPIEMPAGIDKGRVVVLSADNNEGFVLGLHGRGLLYYSYSSNAFTSICTSSNPLSFRLLSNVSNVFIDKSRRVWVCHPHKGLSLLYSHASPFSFSPIHDNITITSMLGVDDSTLVVTTEGDGLYQYSLTRGFVGNVPLPMYGVHNDKRYVAHSICSTSSDQAWFVAEGQGIQSFDVAAKKMCSLPLYLKRFNDDRGITVRSLQSNSEDKLVVGGEEDWVAVVDLRKNNVSELRFDSLNGGDRGVRCFSNVLGNDVWIGSYSHVFPLDIQACKFGAFVGINDSLDDEIAEIVTLHNQDNTFLWIGTSSGLRVMNISSNSFVDVRARNNKLLGKIYSISPVDGQTMLLTLEHGVALVSTIDFNVKIINSAHGIEEEEFIAAKAVALGRGKVLLAGQTGITLFDIDAAKRIRESDSKITISNIKLSHKSVFRYDQLGLSKIFKTKNDSTAELSVAYDNNALTIEFSALQYEMPATVHYRYMLDGVDQDWVYVDAFNRAALYSSLPKGKYLFRVQASNQFGQWMNTSQNIILKIHAPFWKGGWFYLILFLFVAGLITLFYLQRLSNLTRIRTVLERQVEQRTRLLEKQKSEIERQKSEIKDQRDVENFQKREIETQKEKLAKQKEELEKSQAALEEVLQHRKAVLEEARIKAQNYEKKLDLIKNEFSLLADAIPQCVMLMKIEDESFEFVGQSALSVTGYAAHEFVENPSLFRLMIADDYKDFFAEQRKKLAHEAMDPSAEFVITTKSGLRKPVLQKNVILTPDNAKPEYLLIILFEAAEARKEVNPTLDIAHADAVRAPINTVLHPNSDTLHDIASILSNPYLSFDDKKAFIDKDSQNNESLIHIIDDIIDLSKVDAGSMELNISRCFVNQLLVDLHKSFSKLISTTSPNNITLRLQLPVEDNSFSILTDTYRLKQVLMNLIGNALKYTQQGSVELGYEIGKQISPGVESILFFVKDTGIGIPAQYQSSIFNVENPDKPLSGKGVGLSLTKKLVELLGGRLSFNTEEGRGSTFMVELPAKSEPNVKFDDFKADKTPVDWSKKVFLIAEDEDMNFRFIKAALSKTKATLLRAQDGEEAVAIIKERRRDIDLILMDMQMPILNGYEATKQIKKIEKNVPIIAQTAFAMAGQKIKCFEAGCDGYISKPYKAKDLVETISKQLLSF